MWEFGTGLMIFLLLSLLLAIMIIFMNNLHNAKDECNNLKAYKMLMTFYVVLSIVILFLDVCAATALFQDIMRW